MLCMKCGYAKCNTKAKTKDLRGHEKIVDCCENCIKQYPDKYKRVEEDGR